jgi:hypothetical protein
VLTLLMGEGAFEFVGHDSAALPGTDTERVRLRREIRRGDTLNSA